jgi:phosphonate transport system permease protein
MTERTTVSQSAFNTSDLDSVRSRFGQHMRPDMGQRMRTIAIGLALTALFITGLNMLEFSPLRIWNGVGKLGEIIGLMLPPSVETMSRFWLYLQSLGETLAIAFLGTSLACVIAFPLALLAARNVVPFRLPQFMMRRGLDTIRGIDTLIWALIWINVVGLGPFAGVLAIMTSDIGSFGKLFSETFESADRKPMEGILASGGSHMASIRHGLIPQVLPVIASQWLYFFESNTRSATIIGIVGAGGIGQYLYEEIKVLEWGRVSFLIVLVLIAVYLIDTISARLRFAIIGQREGA